MSDTYNHVSLSRTDRELHFSFLIFYYFISFGEWDNIHSALHTNHWHLVLIYFLNFFLLWIVKIKIAHIFCRYRAWACNLGGMGCSAILEFPYIVNLACHTYRLFLCSNCACTILSARTCAATQTEPASIWEMRSRTTRLLLWSHTGLLAIIYSF